MVEPIAELLTQALPDGPAGLRSQAGGAALSLALHCECTLPTCPPPALSPCPGSAATVLLPLEGLELVLLALYTSSNSSWTSLQA